MDSRKIVNQFFSNESNEANNFSDYQEVVLPVASKQKIDAAVKKKLDYKGQVMPV